MQTNQRSSAIVSSHIKGEESIDQLGIHMKTDRITHIVIHHVAEGCVNRHHGTVGILEGAKVISSDGKEIGSIEVVLARPEENGPEHYLIASGLLLKGKNRVPVEWIHSFGQDEVRLGVASGTAEELEEYELAPVQ